ncbi:hypothetical protein GGX14DRAFT_579071 [Mycena pura]|uniref:Uncharacterized protein n=1 Tax=Mycena pura TaxID=153505 RepID=A0AAD6UNW4_9AGAR|nr:hypothetical protein GGX14DRAFT_579071 [Mycena pura]
MQRKMRWNLVTAITQSLYLVAMIKNTESFITAAARIPASGVAAAFPVNPDGVPLPPMAFILVHEVQHCNLLVDNHHLSDQKALDGENGLRVPAGPNNDFVTPPTSE